MLKKLFEKHSSLRYILSSAASWAVDNGLYYVLLHFCFAGRGTQQVAASTAAQVIARVFSSFFNFNCNNFLVFRNQGSYGKALFKYYCLCIPQAAVSVLLLEVVIAGMSIPNDLVLTAVKIGIEAVLFMISYFIQNKWVFRKKA